MKLIANFHRHGLLSLLIVDIFSGLMSICSAQVSPPPPLPPEDRGQPPVVLTGTQLQDIFLGIAILLVVIFIFSILFDIKKKGPQNPTP